MKISLRWIEEILGQTLNLPIKDLSDLLLQLGFEVSSAQTYRQCQGITVAEVLEISKHPNADRLQIVLVTDGQETQKVVCGAPNLVPGRKVFWAKVGASLAQGDPLREATIRGVRSPGMLCSAKELGIGEDQSGLLYLPQETKLGTALESLVRLEDIILECEITPNRPDCLCQIGIAREIAAKLNRNLPEPQLKIPDMKTLPKYNVEVQDPQGCPRYSARKIEGVRVAASPLSLQVRLIRCGIRPINNIVDITNAVLLEIGQPLHAFDADKLAGGKIVVRRAKTGEAILALDGKTYPLDPEILVIADAKKPVAIAGIMGGEETAVTAQTQNILLESAQFDRRLIRNAKKRLNLASESSYRFERGVSAWSCVSGSDRALTLILDNSQTKITAAQDVASSLPAEPTVSLITSQIEKVLGEKISAIEIEDQLKKIGVPILSQEKESLTVRNPEWRLDLSRMVDYAEEIIRLRGYETIAPQGARIRLGSASYSDDKRRWKRDLRQTLNSLGFYEAYNYGFVSEKSCRDCADRAQPVAIENPLAEDQSLLRPSLLTELLKNLQTNLSYQKKDIRLFEIGTTFHKKENGLEEKEMISAAACGNAQLPFWKSPEPRPIDFFWLKGVIERIFSQLHVNDTVWQPFHHASFHPHFSFLIEKEQAGRKTSIGVAGLIHPQISKEWNYSEPVALMELDLAALLENAARQKKISPVPRTPAIQRDCSVWIPETVSWNEIFREIRNAGGNVLENCIVFDQYSDSNSAGKKSLSFTLTFRDSVKTLEDAAANNLRD
ncbi:MAG: phenylalanine--tRNA ligase subunit beta, partial [Elusimicrobia bacterium]|nr:phenylalanine--tRNA ligase subunit beta [Elusimicrobiota bacterium]